MHLTTALPDLSCHILPSKTRILSILSTGDCKNVPRCSPLSHPCPLQCDLAAYCIKRQKLLLLSLNLDWPWNLHWPMESHERWLTGSKRKPQEVWYAFSFSEPCLCRVMRSRLACWRRRGQVEGSPDAQLRPLRPVYISQGPNMCESPARSAELSPEAR